MPNRHGDAVAIDAAQPRHRCIDNSRITHGLQLECGVSGIEAHQNVLMDRPLAVDPLCPVLALGTRRADRLDPVGWALGRPKIGFELKVQLVEQAHAQGLDGLGLGSRQARCEHDVSRLQYPQRNGDHHHVGIVVAFVCAHHHACARVVDGSHPFSGQDIQALGQVLCDGMVALEEHPILTTERLGVVPPVCRHVANHRVRAGAVAAELCFLMGIHQVTQQLLVFGPQGLHVRAPPNSGIQTLVTVSILGLPNPFLQGPVQRLHTALPLRPNGPHNARHMIKQGGALISCGGHLCPDAVGQRGDGVAVDTMDP